MLGSLCKGDYVLSNVSPDEGQQVFQHLEGITVGKNLTKDQKERLSSLIEKYKDIFATNPKKPNPTSMMEHGIDTGDALCQVPIAFE